MATKEQNEEKNLEIGDVITKSELFIEKNQKTIIIVVAAILVVVLAFFGLRKWYFQPRQVQAAEEMFAAENYFDNGQYELALKGNDQFLGFEDVISDYGCTKAGKLAKYYAGICELNLGNYESAIKYLKSYKGKDTFTKVEAVMLIGDAELEQGNTDAAIKQYLKAAKMEDNFVTAPTALFKAGMAYMMSGNNAKAVDCFKQIKAKYPESTEWNEVDKYLAFAESL